MCGGQLCHAPDALTQAAFLSTVLAVFHAAKQLRQKDSTDCAGQLQLWILGLQINVSTCGLVPQALHPDGLEMATGGRRSALHCWDLPASALPGAAACGPPPGKAGAGSAKLSPSGRGGGVQKRQKGAAAAAADTPTTSGQRRPLGMQGGAHGEATVDGLLFLPGGRLVSKSADGRAFVWDYAARHKLASWKARGSLPFLVAVKLADGRALRRSAPHSASGPAGRCGGHTVIPGGQLPIAARLCGNAPHSASRRLAHEIACACALAMLCKEDDRN